MKIGPHSPRSHAVRRIVVIVSALVACISPVLLVGTSPSAAAVRSGARAFATANRATTSPHSSSSTTRPTMPRVVNLPLAVVGKPYFATLPVSRSGGAAWKWEAGMLPAGLRLATSQRSVVGVPSLPGTWTVAFSRHTAGARTPQSVLVRVTVLGAAERAARTARPTATTGAISGTVTSASGPITGACVTAAWSGGGGKRTITTATGAYSLSGLAPGVWEVSFSGCGTQDFVTQWWKSQPTVATAHAVIVAAGKTTTGISAKLADGGQISGTVTAAESGHGLGSACAYALNGTGFAAGSAMTDASGDYTIAGLPKGNYEVEFAPCSRGLDRLVTWWNNQNGALATPVSVAVDGTTTGISVAMSLGGKISGTVTSAATGKGIGGVCAAAFLPPSQGSPSGGAGILIGSVPFAAAEAPSAADGTYTMTGLAPGDYQVEFAPCGTVSTVNYVLPVMYKPAADPTVQQPVVVTAGATTTGVGITLKPGGEVTGVITSAITHKPLAGMCAYIIDPNTGFFFQSEPSKATGVYLALGLAPGAYQAELGPCGLQNYLFVPWERGATFAVRAGAVTSGISASLLPGGEITGTVASTKGVPLSDLCALLEQVTAQGGFIEEFGPVGFAGTFSITQLPTGDYSVGFAPCDPQFNLNYLSELWNNGTPVPVKAGGPAVTGIDVKLPPGGQITGSVTDSSSNPLSFTCVIAEPSNGNFTTFPVEGISIGGKYNLAGLATGTYQVFFNDCNGDNYQPAEYGNGLDVNVTAGQITPGISGVLDPGGEISGTVTNTSAVGLSDICVAAIGEFQPQPVEAVTAFGSYSFVGLTPNTEYEVEFITCGVGNYATQWWEDATTQAAATPFTVTVASPATGIDATMTS